MYPRVLFAQARYNTHACSYFIRQVPSSSPRPTRADQSRLGEWNESLLLLQRRTLDGMRQPQIDHGTRFRAWERQGSHSSRRLSPWHPWQPTPARRWWRSANRDCLVTAASQAERLDERADDGARVQSRASPAPYSSPDHYAGALFPYGSGSGHGLSATRSSPTPFCIHSQA